MTKTKAKQQCDDNDVELQLPHHPTVIVEDVTDDLEEEKGGDTLGELPAPAPAPAPARPTLHGLDKVLSTRFVGVDNGPGTGSSDINVNGGNGNHQQKNQNANKKKEQRAPNYNDYLEAQRSMMKSQRNISHSTAVMLHSLTHAEDNTTTTTNTNTNISSSINNSHTEAAAPSSPKSRAPRRIRSFEETKTLQALKALKRRGSTTNINVHQDNSDEILNILENIDEDGHFINDDDDDLHDSVLPMYSVPVQRQRWGEDQILPHVNWGDLFFDLFYVAMAYNLGGMVISAMADTEKHGLRGSIYYVGLFGPLWHSWEVSMFYSSRYTSVDYAHRMFEVVRYIFVSMAVLNVKPVELLGDPKSAEVMLFTLAILCEGLMHLALSAELYYRGLGDTKAIKDHTLMKVKCEQLPTLAFYLAAFVLATVFYVQSDEGEVDKENQRLLGADVGADADTYGKESSYATDNPHWKMSDLPLTLMAVAYLLNFIVTAVRKLWVTSGKHGKIQERYVPSNTDYVIHRYGEWILLMIGEGILSLLIVETVETRGYYIVTVFGTLTIIFIQTLKFESEPSHAMGHAMHSRLSNGMCYSFLIQGLSMSLIVFGVTYKIFLKGILKEMNKSAASRLLAGASPSISNQTSANVFAFSLLVVLLSMELMCLTHSGLTLALGHLVVRSKGETQKASPHWPVVVIAIFKVAILVFTLTLSTWTTDPAVLTVSGCFVVFAIAITRVANFFFIHKKEVIQDMTANVLNTFAPIIEGDTRELSKMASSFGNKIVNSIVPNNGSAQSIGKKGGDSTSSIGKKGGDSTSSNISNDSTAGPTRRTSGDADLTSGMNSSFDGVIVANLNGIITQVNETAVTLFGYATKKEMIGKNLHILVGGSDGKRHDGYVKAFKKRVTTQENPQHKILGRQRMLHACRADGTEFPCIVGIKMISNNTKIAGFIRDMTGIVSKEKSKVDVTMSDDEAMQKVLDDNAFDAIIATNDRGVIQGVNVTAVDEFGYSSKNELIGEKLSVLIQGVTPQQLVENHGSQRLETLTRKDGTEFQSIVASAKIKGTSNMFASYIRNIDFMSATKSPSEIM